MQYVKVGFGVLQPDFLHLNLESVEVPYKMPGINGAKHLCTTNNSCWVILIALMFVILICIVAMRVVMVILVLVNCNVVADLANGSTRINSQTKLTYLGLLCVTSTFT